MLAGPDQPGLEWCPGRPPPFTPQDKAGPRLCSALLVSLLALDHTRLDGGWSCVMEQCGSWSWPELGSDPALGTLLAGGLEQVTYLFESIFFL